MQNPVVSSLSFRAAAFFLLLATASAMAQTTAPAIKPNVGAPFSDEGARSCSPIFDIDKESLYDFVRLRALSPPESVEGQRIASLRILPLPIFDEKNPRENHWLYRLANKLHIDTKPSAIEQQLLINEGDSLSSSTVAETERLLRTSKYLFDAAVIPVARCSDGVDLLVLTREVWTLEPRVSFGHSSGNSKSSLGISDDNILGTGNRASLSYEKNSQRTSTTASYKNENIFGSRWQVRSDYSDTSDGSLHKLSLTRPFYSLDTKWATGVSTERSDLNQEIYVPGMLSDTDDGRRDFQHKHAKDDVFVGFSRGLQDGFTSRWSVGFSNEEDHFANKDGLPVAAMDRERNYPWLESQWVEDRFTTLENLNQIHRTEDVPLGLNLRTRIGYAPSAWDTQDSQWIYQVELADTLSDGAHHLFQVSGLLNGSWLMPDDRAQNTLLNLKAEYHYLESPYRRWYARLQYDYGKNLTPDMWFTLNGLENSMRGYPNDAFYADERTVLTIERRYFSDIHLFNLIRVGAAAFFDAGRSKLSTDSAANSPWLADAGFGLRLSSSKSSSGVIVHLDLAYPLIDRDLYNGHQWTITSSETF